ncbi:hypothetical protein K488DRAFT_73362 [Vararia minispora EC-137]|uniref:Uncharacterized protein n=1 Tax=Vararia minispora EC-137 TaxID=1314806 RepID=A0ACB8QBG2_9AGAM|nr:hypothetical protein K488DRAFT_73362 [Vararia minispora EC-137]
MALCKWPVRWQLVGLLSVHSTTVVLEKMGQDPIDPTRSPHVCYCQAASWSTSAGWTRRRQSDSDSLGRSAPLTHYEAPKASCTSCSSIGFPVTFLRSRPIGGLPVVYSTLPQLRVTYMVDPGFYSSGGIVTGGRRRGAVTPSRQEVLLPNSVTIGFSRKPAFMLSPTKVLLYWAVYFPSETYVAFRCGGSERESHRGADVMETKEPASFDSATSKAFPIDHIPSEILLEMFFIDAARNEPAVITAVDACSGVLSVSHPCLPNFVRLSHVCRRWRSICLGSRYLWAKNVGIVPTEINTFLSRAGDTVPIDFRLTLARETYELEEKWPFHLWFPVNRLRSLEVNTGENSSDALALLDFVRWKHFPLLHTLSLRNSSGVRQPEGPPVSLSVHMPNLRHARLINFVLPLVAPSLVSLHIESILSSANDSLASLILNILRQSPLLHHLRIDATILPHIDSSTPTFHLSKLETLAIEDFERFQDILTLLKVIQIPLSTCLDLVPASQCGPDISYLSFVAGRVWQDRAPDGLNITCGNPAIFTFYSSRVPPVSALDVRPFPAASSHRRGSVQVTLRIGRSLFEIIGILDAVLHVDLSTISILSVDGRRTKRWREMLRAFPNVRTLYIAGTLASKTLHMLAQPPILGSTVLFPNLNTLCITTDAPEDEIFNIHAAVVVNGLSRRMNFIDASPRCVRFHPRVTMIIPVAGKKGKSSIEKRLEMLKQSIKFL